MGTLYTQRLGSRHIIVVDFCGLSNGNTVSNQFMNPQSNTSANTTTESTGQQPASVNFKLWRFQGSFGAAGTQQATMTVRINGVSQGSTATVVGTAAGAVTTDLATALAIVRTDALSVLFVTGVADATATRPRGMLVGAASGTL